MHNLCVAGLERSVHLVHIGPMTRLSDWMDAKGIKDEALAEKAKGAVSRTQISRIRRGLSGASKKTAHKLEKITGIPWHEFIGGAP